MVRIFKRIGNRRLLVALALVVLIIVPGNSAFAAWDIYGGGMNVFQFIKLVALIVSVGAAIRELASRRSLLYIVGLLAIAIFIYSSYEPDDIKQMGNGIKALLKINHPKSDTVPTQQEVPGSNSNGA